MFRKDEPVYLKHFAYRKNYAVYSSIIIKQNSTHPKLGTFVALTIEIKLELMELAKLASKFPKYPL